METSQQAGDAASRGGRQPTSLSATSDPDPPGQYLVKTDVNTLGIGIVIGVLLASLLSRCGCERPRC